LKFMFRDAVVRRMKLADLKPAEYNPRIISKKAFDGLGASMLRFGLLMPIVWNQKTGNIVGGHQRYKHLVESGVTETDVVVVNLSDHEEMMLNITLNNREIRGDFSEEVVGQLRLAEVQIGDAFRELGLAELMEQMQRLYPHPEKKEWKVEDSDQDSGKPKTNTSARNHTKQKVGGKEGAAAGEDVNRVEAYITCPKCKSRWDMKTKKVIWDATKEQKDVRNQKLEGGEGQAE